MPKDKKSKPKVAKQAAITTRIVLSSTIEDDFRQFASMDDLSNFVAHVEDYCFEQCLSLSKVQIQFSFDSITAVITE